MDIEIDLLKNDPGVIPQLAKIWYEVLGKVWIPDASTLQVEQKLREHLNEDVLPITFVAFVNKKPVGMCSLRINDGIRPDLLPWLGSLVIDADFQKRGVGKKLIEATIQKAHQLGYEKLYLFVLDPDLPPYYESLGWEKIDIDNYKGNPVSVFERNVE